MRKTTLTCLILTVGMFHAMPVYSAQPLSVEERLQKVEEQLSQVLQENAELKKELGHSDKSPLIVVKPKGKENKLTVGGYLQAQGEVGDAPDARFNNVEDRFLVRRARIQVDGKFLENFDFRLQGDFSGSLGETSGFRFKGADLYLNWNRFDFANVKAGQFKTPFGYEQLTPDTKTLTIERSLPNDRGTDSRQVGVAVSGSVLDKRLNYTVGIFNGTGANANFNDNEDFMYVGRVQGIPVKTKWGKQDVQWAVAFNALTTHDSGVKKSGFSLDSTPGGSADNLFFGNRTSWGFDTQFQVGPLQLLGEYIRVNFRPDNAIPASSFDGDLWYVMGTYEVLPKKLQGVVRYEMFDPNVSMSGDDTTEWTFGLTYFIKGNDLKLMLNYLLGNPAGGPSNQGRLLARMQVAF